MVFQPPNNSMEPTRPAGCLVWRDTSLGWPGGSSRGRSASQMGPSSNIFPRASRQGVARPRWVPLLRTRSFRAHSPKPASQGTVTLQVHEVFTPISKRACRPWARDPPFEVLGSAAEQLAEADPACRVSFSALFCLTRGLGLWIVGDALEGPVMVRIGARGPGVKETKPWNQYSPDRPAARTGRAA